MEPVKGGAQLRPVLAGAGGLHDDFTTVRGRQGVKLSLVVLATTGHPAEWATAGRVFGLRERLAALLTSDLPEASSAVDVLFGR